MNNTLRSFLFPRLNRRLLIRTAIVATAAFAFFGTICLPMKVRGLSMSPTYRDRGSEFMVIQVNKFVLAAVVCVVALAVIGRISHVRSDRYRIQRNFARLSELAAVKTGEGLISKGRKSDSLGGLFTAESTLSTPVSELSGVYSRQEITQTALGLKTQCERLSLDFFDLNIEKTGPNTATCGVTARLQGKLDSGDVFDEVRELECQLVEEGGHWLFSECIADRIVTR